MAVLPLLADESNYRAHTVDMIHDERAREYWLNVFVEHLPNLERHAIESQSDRDDVAERARGMRQRFGRTLEQIRRRPNSHGPLSIILLGKLREQCLREFGFDDPYAPLKQRENDQALASLPELLKELDSLDEAERLEAMIAGTFAGNIFDMGAAVTAKLYAEGAMDFRATRQRVAQRPWLVDDFDAWQDRMLNGPAHRLAVMLVDNAGADVVLGMIPLARELLRRGTSVIISANSNPALNDITHDELVPLIDRAGEIDAVMRDALVSGQLRLVPSGNGSPLIDLTQISDELAEASRDADLLVIEGMGRALETNYHTRFTCESLKLAMVKEQHIAEVLGGGLYDVVCRYEAPISGAAVNAEPGAARSTIT